MTTSTKNHFATNLLQLQNHIKRDPTSYKDEFAQTYLNYESTLQAYLMKPAKQNKQLADLALFLAHVSHCFSEELKQFPQQLIDILKRYATVLNPEMRLTFCKCLMLLRTKNLIEPKPLFEIFFTLIKCQDKLLRKTLFEHMLNDVKRIKTKLKNYKLLSQVQQYVFTLTKENHPLVGKYALSLMIELYKKQIWDDAKTVNVIAQCCFSKITKVLALALQFFLGKDVEKDSDNESDSEDEKSTQQVLLSLRVGKKTKSRQKKTDRALKSINKEKKKNKKKNGIPHFSGLNLIYDPQDFAEKLFKLVESTNEGFEIKITILDLISRLIGIHSLFVMNFHQFLIRFLNPHQREVTKILWFSAISSHDLTPPDTVEPVLMAIANNFITERNNSEVIAVGLNSIREICSRCPLAMNEDLLGDLVLYRTYKDKAVSYAAKSLIQLFREKNPQMLHRKMRGKPTEETYVEGAKVRQYGELDAKSYIPGAEIIDLSDSEEKKQEGKTFKIKQGSDDEDEDDEDGEWVEASDSEDEEEEQSNKPKKRKHSEDDEDSSEGEWVDVSSDGEVDENGGNVDEGKELLTLAQKEEKALKVSTERILTQEEFKKIRMEQMKKKLTDKNFDKKGKKKNITIDSEPEEDEDKLKNNGLVPLSSITSINKKKAHDKEARLARIQEGREGRDKFGHRFKDSKLGKTNKEKLKNKSFQMLRPKLNKKHKRSFKDKQIALRNSLNKQKKMK